MKVKNEKFKSACELWVHQTFKGVLLQSVSAVHGSSPALSDRWGETKRCVPVQIFWDSWSPKLIVQETLCPWIDKFLSNRITYTYCTLDNDKNVSIQ